MSLKSKLEAVIYAAEEPVTLTQLATLFGAESLEFKAAQEAAAAQKASADAAAPAGDSSQAVLVEGLEYLDLRAEDGALLEQPDPVPEAAPEETSAEAPSSEDPPAETAPLDPESEAKRIARQRDRDIKAVLRRLIDELISEYSSDDRGIEIREIAGGYRMATKPECHDAVRMFIKSLKPPMKLSLPALETLAVIAYKQPVTAPEVNEIRGVDSSGVFGSLLARKLITTAGRKAVLGRPILYKTTREFLMRFGLKDVNELPSMDEFEKIASELEEAEPTPIVDPQAADAYDAEGDAGPELDENASEESGGELDNDSPTPAAKSSPAPELAGESNH